MFALIQVEHEKCLYEFCHWRIWEFYPKIYLFVMSHTWLCLKKSLIIVLKMKFIANSQRKNINKKVTTLYQYSLFVVAKLWLVIQWETITLLSFQSCKILLGSIQFVACRFCHQHCKVFQFPTEHDFHCNYIMSLKFSFFLVFLWTD